MKNIAHTISLNDICDIAPEAMFSFMGEVKAARTTLQEVSESFETMAEDIPPGVKVSFELLKQKLLDEIGLSLTLRKNCVFQVDRQYSSEKS